MNHLLIRCCCILALVVATNAAVAAEPQERQILVTGEAEAVMAPDMATLQLSVSREAETARAALDLNSAAMKEVISALREAGVASRDLQTSGLDIQPRYDYPGPRNEHPPKLIGYTVRNSLGVRVRELDKLGGVIDRAVTLGVNQVGAIRFGNLDPGAALDKARAEAVHNALSRAEILADAAGLRLGEVLEIAEQSRVPEPRPMLAARAMAMDAVESVPIEVGENSYRVVVQLRIAIRQ